MFDTPCGLTMGVLIRYDNNITENVRITTLMSADMIASISGGGSRCLQLRLEMSNFMNHTQHSGVNRTTNIVTSAGQSGNNIFNDYKNLTITNNLRPSGSTRPLGTCFGEYSSARDPRIIQLGVKVYF